MLLLSLGVPPVYKDSCSFMQAFTPNRKTFPAVVTRRPLLVAEVLHYRKMRSDRDLRLTGTEDAKL